MHHAIFPKRFQFLSDLVDRDFWEMVEYNDA
jgi:hypothetical protein